jgi:hypothetical protein
MTFKSPAKEAELAANLLRPNELKTVCNLTNRFNDPRFSVFLEIRRFSRPSREVVKARIVALNYRWSSYNVYAGKAENKAIKRFERRLDVDRDLKRRLKTVRAMLKIL